jgi:DNA-binding transcriptional LysR family regulator
MSSHLPQDSKERIVDWDKLRIFQVTAEARSFTKAGEKLSLSQSAVSRQIAALEHDLKAPLFHRHARGLVLTEQGELLLTAADDMRVRFEKTRARLTQASEVPAGVLKVTATVGLGSTWLTRRVGEFLDLYPEIRIELVLTNSEVDLTMREADVAIRLRRPEQQNLIQRRLFTVHYHAYAAPDYIKRFGEPQAIDDLDQHRIVCLGGDQPTFILNMHALTSLGRDPNNARTNVLVVNDSFALRRAVETGAGIGMCPDYSVEGRAELVRVLRDVEMPSLDAYLVYSAEMRSLARLQVFRDFLVSKAQRWAF